MDFLTLAQSRRSVRHYTSQPVEQEKLRQILKAAQAAPTACNLQPQRLLVIQSSQGMEKLAKACRPHGAPMAIIVCADRDNVWQRSFDGATTLEVDASIVTDHMMLQAASLGLGSCWLCWFDPQILRQEFSIPHHLVPVNILVLGYPEQQPAPTPRKPLEETVWYETF